MKSSPASARTSHLESHESWKLLRTAPVARLAVWVKDHPEIFPVNFQLDHGTVVFRTGPGTKLDGALSGLPVAFEADGLNEYGTIAWSVVIKGQVEAITRFEDVLNSVSLLLFPWEEGDKDHFLRIVPTEITGRRFTIVPPNTWWEPLEKASRAPAE